jgi:hypothetical protein
MAACDAAKEIIWLQDILTELSILEEEACTLYQDNQGAIFIENNNAISQRTKHIDIRYYYIREQILMNKIEIKYCPTEQMTADILTKPLALKMFASHRNQIMNYSTELDNFVAKGNVKLKLQNYQKQRYSRPDMNHDNAQ